MTFRKRLAAGLLAAVTAVSATISAGAIEGGWLHLYENRELGEDGYYGYWDEHTVVFLDGETIETLTDLGTIENLGEPANETTIRIPPEKLSEYPIGTVFSIKSDGWNFYARDNDRGDYYQGSGSHFDGKYYVLTRKMKESGILLTGYADADVGETRQDSGSVTIESVSFSNAVAVEHKSVNLALSAESDLYKLIPIAVEGVNRGGILLDESGSAKISTEMLKEIPVGSIVHIGYDTSKKMTVGESYTFNMTVNRTKYYTCEIEQKAVSITDPSAQDSEAALFDYRSRLTIEFSLTSEMKMNGLTFTGPNDVYINSIVCWVPDENSEITPIQPVVKPGFSTPTGETSVKEVPLGTVVTQKTAVSDGRYGERFVKKIAASEIEGKTKATFTLSNGTFEKTVPVTCYYTSLTVDGETVSAGSGYVFLVYTLSGIPEGVNVTVTDVTLE